MVSHARTQRGSSEAAHCASTGTPQPRSTPSLHPPREWPKLPFTARIERAQFHRARSASKKGTWPLPLFLSSLTRKRTVWLNPRTARVQRGSSDSSPSPEGVGKPSFTARIERPPLYRGGSASKKDGCLLPCFPFSVTSRSSRHLRLLLDLPNGTLPRRTSLSNSHAATL